MKWLVVLLVLAATTAQGEIYTWRDSRGTSHYTNDLESIPPRYRSKVKTLALPGEQKAGSSPVSPGTSSPPAVVPAPPAAESPPITPTPPPPAVVTSPDNGRRRELRRERRRRKRSRASARE